MVELTIPKKDTLTKEEQDAIKRIPNLAYVAEIRIIQTRHPDIFTLILVDEQDKDAFRATIHRNVAEQFLIDAKANGIQIAESLDKVIA